MKKTESVFTDPRDGKVYKTVKIGKQVWMAENLSYNVPDSRFYDDDPANDKYGRLYSWSDAEEACPPGWHLPSDDEWETLVNFAGGDEIAGKKLKAKSGWNDNDGKSGNGTDDYGFSALPGGYGDYVNKFSNIGCSGGWWTATEDKNIDYNNCRSSKCVNGRWIDTTDYTPDHAYIKIMSFQLEEVGDSISSHKANLRSVRCVRD